MSRLPMSSFAFLLPLMVGCTQSANPIETPETSRSAPSHTESISVDAVPSQTNDKKNVVVAMDNDSKAAPAVEITSKHVNPPLTEDEEAACLFVLQWQLSGTDPDDVKFVAIGRKEGGPFDPTDAALKRLSVSGLKLLPASKARLPEPGEKESTGRFRGVEDPTTGKRSYIYSAIVKARGDVNTVEVSYENFSSPLGSDGGTVIVARKNGEWSIKEHKDQWID